jgi:hypothetical protein
MLYASKHSKLSFDLIYWTFQLAAAAMQETWFIVMHPVLALLVGKPLHILQQQERLKKQAQSSCLSRLQHHYA